MTQKPPLTDEFLNEIISSKHIDSIPEGKLTGSKDLGTFLTQKLEEKNLKRIDVIRAAQLNETFGYQIFSGTRKPSRNYILAIGLVMGLSLHDLRMALCCGDAGDLYAKNRRDAIILFCASHGYALVQTDEELYRLGEETVSDGGERRE